MFTELFVGLFVVIFTYYMQIYLRNLIKLQKFPGPHPLPIIGNFYKPVAVYSLFRFMAGLRKDFGKTFVMYLFSKPYLVVLEPTVVRRVLSDSKAFVKGVDYSSTFATLFGEGLVTSGHEKHRHDRSIFNKYFIKSSVLKRTEMYNAITEHAIGQLLDEELGDKQEMDLNIEKFFAVLSLRVFMNFSCHTDYREDLKRERELCDLVSVASYSIAKMIQFSTPLFRFIPWVDATMTCREEMRKETYRIVENRRKAIAAGEDVPDDCIAAMLDNDLDDKDMVDHTTTLICAGHDTTAFFSAYVCLLLAQNPNCQEKLRDLIFAAVGDRTDITTEDISAIPYLHQVMEETLRLFAIIPVLTRVTANEVTIKDATSDTPDGALRDMTIPAGTDIMIPMYLLNREPSVWENPGTFDPSRFEGHGDYTSAKSGFFPFGYGTRTCIGNTLAQVETSIFMIHLLRRYKLKPTPGFKIDILAGISLTTSNGVRVIAEKLQ